MKNLREKAENILATKDKMSEYDNYNLAKLIEELNTYQIELELQNEELITTNELLNQSKKQYMDLYENAPVPYFTLDRNQLITELNYSAAKLLNSTRITLINISFDSYLDSTDKTIFEHLFAQCFETNETITTELKIKQNDKIKYMQITLNPYYDRFYHGKMMRVIAVDITDKKLQHNALKISEEKYRAVFEGSSDAIFTIERNAITTCNWAFLDLFGFEAKSDIINKEVEFLFPEIQENGHKSELVFHKYLKEVRGNGSVKFNFNFMKNSRDTINTEVLLTSIDLDDENIIHCNVRGLK